MTIQCRHIICSDDIEKVVDLHGLVWDTGDRDAIPSHVVTALLHVGGLLLGAFDVDRVVAFSLAFPGLRDNKLILWSHATGVLPEYQGRGIGTRLKWLQRDLAIQRGFDCINWTFDPLQAGNAHFNIHHLGCLCNRYHDDFYGEVADGLNQGLPTDRFEVKWELYEPKVQSRAIGNPPHLVLPLAPPPFVLSSHEDGSGHPSQIAWPDHDSKHVLVEIPGDINGLRRNHLEVAVSWRLATRQAFAGLFTMGFTVVDFLKRVQAFDKEGCAYVLERIS
jgi:predicted GNAT superfamily acetyltransferase